MAHAIPGTSTPHGTPTIGMPAAGCLHLDTGSAGESPDVSPPIVKLSMRAHDSVR
jgi:hypothetical protein